MHRDAKLIAEAYNSVTPTKSDWTNMGDWVKFFSSPNVANQRVSYETETAEGGGRSYGAGVTFNKIINDAQTLLSHMGHNPQDKQRILTQTANQLQDYFAGLSTDSRVPQQFKLDNKTRDSLMDVVTNLDNVESFVNSFGKMPQQQPQIAKQTAIPGHGPAVTQAQKDAEEFRAVGDDEMVTGPEGAVGSSKPITRTERSFDNIKRQLTDRTLSSFFKDNYYGHIKDANTLMRHPKWGMLSAKYPNLVAPLGRLATLPVVSTEFTPQQKEQFADLVIDSLKAFDAMAPNDQRMITDMLKGDRPAKLPSAEEIKKRL